jgi:hypothetical protein
MSWAVAMIEASKSRLDASRETIRHPHVLICRLDTIFKTGS